jgi:hypothetical protein
MLDYERILAVGGYVPKIVIVVNILLIIGVNWRSGLLNFVSLPPIRTHISSISAPPWPLLAGLLKRSGARERCGRCLRNWR